MSDYRLELAVKNNLLFMLMQERGIKTAAELSRACNVSQRSIGQMLNLKKSAYNSRLELRADVARVLDFLGALPDEAFPHEVLFDPMAENKFSATMDREELARLSTGGSLDWLEAKEITDKATRDLPERMRGVLMQRINGETLEEIGEELGISRERVRQIELKALRLCRRRLGRDESDSNKEKNGLRFNLGKARRAVWLGDHNAVEK